MSRHASRRSAQIQLIHAGAKCGAVDVRWVVLSCSPCPYCLQYVHGPRPLVVGLPWWLFPLAGVAFLGGVTVAGVVFWVGLLLIGRCGFLGRVTVGGSLLAGGVGTESV